MDERTRLLVRRQIGRGEREEERERKGEKRRQVGEYSKEKPEAEEKGIIKARGRERYCARAL